MTDFLFFIITWINVPINVASRYLLFPISLMPGWLSNTIVAAITGVLLLIIFKHTSNQEAIGRIRDNIKANMLALKLFKDSLSITLQSQARLLTDALLLLVYAIVPLLIMIVPMSFLLAQLGLWYQHRPIMVGEKTVVTVKLAITSNAERRTLTGWPKVSIESTPAVKVITEPVRVFSKQEICWEIQALQNGYHSLIFKVDGKRIEKELAIGEGFMRVSVKRPGRCWKEILLHPAESPFGPDSIIQSITINYPTRGGKVSGTNRWLIYFFVVSLVSALLFKPFLKVRI